MVKIILIVLEIYKDAFQKKKDHRFRIEHAQVTDPNDFKKFGFTNIIMASTAIPILFPPFEFNNDIYVDGGITSNILIYEGIQFCIDNFPDEHIYIDVIICGKQIDFDEILGIKENKEQRPEQTINNILSPAQADKVEWDKILD